MMESEKIIIIIAILTLVIALVILIYNGKKYTPNNSKCMRCIRSEQIPSQDIRMQQEMIEQQMMRQQMMQQQQQMINSQSPEDQKIMIMFFAPWCGHCKNMEPIWDEFVKNFDGYNGIKLMKINGEDNPELRQIHNINAYPIIKYCPKGIKNQDGVVYQGDRSLQSLAQFLQNYA